MIKKRDWRKNKTKNSKRLINRIYIIHSQNFYFILLCQKYIYLFIMKMFCFNIYLRKRESRNKEKRVCECECEEEEGEGER